jgi:soluble lytic murein transglycosylase
MADQMSGTLVGRLARWSMLMRPDDHSSFQDLAQFIAENPDWPNVQALRRRAELAMPDGLPADAVATWFDTFPPLTIDGVIRYGDAIEQSDPIRMQQWVRDTWRTQSLTIVDEARFLGRFGRILGPEDHWARLDALLWAQRLDEAMRIVPLVTADLQKVADARIKLIMRTDDASDAVRAVPAALTEDEGLTFERARWRRRAGDDAGAWEMLQKQPDATLHAGDWWLERQWLMRQAYSDGNVALAYRVASTGTAPDSLSLAETQFFAGWLALRKMGRISEAAGHFERLYAGVGAPVSRARGAYWAGRAYETAGNADEAAAWYEKAAAWPTTFYGQLAASKLGRAALPAPPPDTAPSDEATASFEGNTLVRATRLLEAIGQTARADQFLRALVADAEGGDANLLVAGLAHEMGRTFIGVRAAKAALISGALAFDAAFPLVPLPADLGGLEPALTLAIMRQETEFNAAAISSAGAVGIMQVLPATAQEVAVANRIPFDRGRLLREPLYNARLGSLYLESLIQRYDGDVIRAIAAYNAGYNRVDGWSAPGDTLEARIDWIESLPFAETRNYVQRVLENLQVYRQRLSADDAALPTIEQDLMG